MANRLRTGLEWQIERMEQYASEPIVYRVPGIGHVVDVPAVFAARTEEQEQSSGYMIYVRRPDFLIKRSRLEIAGELIVPARGHEIEYVVNGDTVVYEVIGPADDSGRLGLRWRIHTTLLRVL
jgi:hypothetical protein